MRKILAECPACGGPLVVTGLECVRCGTTVGGRFQPCDFCRLSQEQSTFLRLFVQQKGNLSGMEKVLGISYPTVRNKLDEIVRLLEKPIDIGSQLGQGAVRDAILRQVAAGELSAGEALERLKNLAKGE